MDLYTGRRNRVPVAALVRRTLQTLRPHARDLGSEEELEGVDEILRRGNGADRQLHIFNALKAASAGGEAAGARPKDPAFGGQGDIVEVVREIADATEVAADPQPEPAAAA